MENKSAKLRYNHTIVGQQQPFNMCRNSLHKTKIDGFFERSIKKEKKNQIGAGDGIIRQEKSNRRKRRGKHLGRDVSVDRKQVNAIRFFLKMYN